MDKATVHAIAEELVGGHVEQCQRITAGGNSRLFRLETASGLYALKFYRTSRHDPRDRQETEALALRFLGEHGLRCIPRLLAVNRTKGCSLLEWIEGQPTGSIGTKEIGQVLQWVEALHSLRRWAEPGRLPWASDACCCGAALEAQVIKRHARLLPVLPSHWELADFIREYFTSAMKEQLAYAREIYQKRGLNFVGELPLSWRTLSSSDFGFHNTLKKSGGNLIFLDFEYFGWDDPVKLTADFLLHPGMNLAECYPEGRQQFFDGVIQLFKDDPHFRFRLEALFPLIGLIWVLILLNEFIPEGWNQRCFADDGRDRTKVQKQQLLKAKNLLNHLQVNDWKHPPPES
ncbi:MAG: phosphotransferase [Magnetococcales bacterium]|nr:phosphotransferase [Magnetococcales bacterium]